MTRLLLAMSALLLIGSQFSDAADTTPAMIQYVGSVSINPSQDEKVLADWYERFGIHTKMWPDGGYYGTFDIAAGDTVVGRFFFGIHPRDRHAPAKSSGSVDVVFHVSDYNLYLANAAKKNVVPQSAESDPKLGHFAYFIDPDGNKVTIWGK